MINQINFKRAWANEYQHAYDNCIC